MLPNEHILRSDGLTRVNNNTITQVTSLQHESFNDPIMLIFKGVSQPNSESNYLVTGTLSLLSIHELEPALDDKVLSPYLVFDDEPKQFNLKVLYSDHVFMIVRNINNDRTMLFAKR